jgi:hypothetical protein
MHHAIVMSINKYDELYWTLNSIQPALTMVLLDQFKKSYIVKVHRCPGPAIGV